MILNKKDKKVKPRPERRVSAKQKAIAKGKPSRKFKALQKRSRVESIKAKKKAILEAKQITNTIFPPTPVLFEKGLISREGVRQQILKDIWKKSETTPGLTYSLSNAIIEAKVDAILKKPVSIESIKKYTPSAKAIQHHEYVLKEEEKNKKKRKEYQDLQQSRKLERKQKHSLSNNRLVCIQKENTMLRIPVKDAKLLVDNEKWKFVAKKFWKEARIDKENKFTLYWSVGKVTLKKPTPPNVANYLAKTRKQSEKKKLSEENTITTAIKNRKKRKNIKVKVPKIESIFKTVNEIRTPRLITVAYNSIIIDEESKQYYKFNPAKIKELREKGNTLEDIVAKFLKKNKEVYGYCSYGDIDNPFFLNLAIENGTFTGILKTKSVNIDNNTFLLDITNKMYYIFTEKYYNKLKKTYPTDEEVLIAILSRVKKDPTVLGKYVQGNFSNEYFQKNQLPKLNIDLNEKSI